jgi:hypothetical protein
MLVFTVNKQMYEGFCPIYYKEQSKIVASVSIGDEIEWWRIDSTNIQLAKDELSRYYHSERDFDNVKIILYERK